MMHKYQGLHVSEIMRFKKASIRSAPLPVGTPPWTELDDLTWEEVEAAASRNEPGLKTVRKLLTDQRFDR